MRDDENIRQVAALGADWIGMIFWERSPRSVTARPALADAAADGAALPAMRVGVFVDDTAQNIIARVAGYRLDIVQLHGHESPAFIRGLRLTLEDGIRPGIRFVKAISVAVADDIATYKTYEDCVDYLLFDTKCKCVGGSGHQFDWSMLKAYDGRLPFLLSGGIGPGDAPRLRQTLALDGFPAAKCIGLDLNSRFETAPGLKDIDKLRTFIKAIRP